MANERLTQAVLDRLAGLRTNPEIDQALRLVINSDDPALDGRDIEKQIVRLLLEIIAILESRLPRLP